jgi:116 kDa U5 small nuclear ribonucleoprotein component
MKECNARGPLVIHIAKLIPKQDCSSFDAFGRIFSGTVRPGDKVSDGLKILLSPSNLMMFHSPLILICTWMHWACATKLEVLLQVRVLGESYRPEDEEDSAVAEVSNVWAYQARYRVPLGKASAGLLSLRSSVIAQCSGTMHCATVVGHAAARLGLGCCTLMLVFIEFDALQLLYGAGNWVLLEGLDATISKTATVIPEFLDEEMYIFRPLQFQTQSVVKIATEPLNPSELPKMVEGLRKINKSYPLAVTKVEESGEHAVLGTGEIYLDSLMKVCCPSGRLDVHFAGRFLCTLRNVTFHA